MARFTQCVDTDARLIDTAMTIEGGFMLAAMQLGLKPDEAVARADWFKRQPQAYQTRVIDKVASVQEARDLDKT